MQSAIYLDKNCCLFLPFFGYNFLFSSWSFLLANDICTALRPNPNLVPHARGHIQPLTDAICSLCCGIGGVWIGNRQLASHNKVSGESGVVVRRIVCVPGLPSHSKSVFETSETGWQTDKQTRLNAKYLGQATYGPSVHVKTWPKPHERTSASLSLDDFCMAENVCVANKRLLFWIVGARGCEVPCAGCNGCVKASRHGSHDLSFSQLLRNW